MLTRRQLVAAALAAACAAPGLAAERGTSALRRIHKRIGGRLGVHVLDSQSGRQFGLDGDSRYAMASTFKMPLAAALLWQVDRGAFPLMRELPVSQADLLSHSPYVEQRLKEGVSALSLRDLCVAAVTHSDNAAANVLLKGIGGPEVLTQFARSIGDEVTRFDRMELELNSNLPGDPRDTTTPKAMVHLMLRIFTQDVLSLTSRALLIDWMQASRTGLDRVRAGLPRSWQVGDKTGTGANNAVNDVVVAYPPERRPILIAVYTSESKADLATLKQAHAEIGGVVAREKWP